MAAAVAGADRTVIHGTGSLGRKVLEQGTTQRDVDQLNSPADAQDRQLALPGHGKEGELE